MERGLGVWDTKGSFHRALMGRAQFRVPYIPEGDAVKGALHR